MAAVARLSEEHDSVFHDYVDEAWARVTHRDVRWIDVDETSLRRGYEHLTAVLDLRT